jgi:hypothetical protein
MSSRHDVPARRDLELVYGSNPRAGKPFASIYQRPGTLFSSHSAPHELTQIP